MGFTFHPHPAELTKASTPFIDVDLSIQGNDFHVLPKFGSAGLTKPTPHQVTPLSKMGFTFPPHPAELAKASVVLVNVDSNLEAKDPHLLPEFDSKSLTEPTSPVLYLPPLLSSLPHALPLTTIQSGNPPLSTETRLPDIDPVSLSLHKALHNFRPLTSVYAETDYADAFNWSELKLPEEEEREWYCVVFRSKRKAGSDGGPLYEADRKAHEEAVLNGGLIMYWYGTPDPETGMNLATCIWQSRRHATAASSRPHHHHAMKLAAVSYEIYNLERHKLQKLKGEAVVTIQPFAGGDVGW